MTTRILAALGALAVVAGSLQAQQPSASGQAFGLAGNFTAAARNYDAIAWNPANLALPGTSVMSLNLGALGGSTGLEPVSLTMIGEHNGATIPAETKERWLQLIEARGRERGNLDAGASLVALTIRNVGFQVGTAAYAQADLNRDAAEVLLYGNAGRTGTPGDFALAGSSARGAVFTTGAMSVAVPLPVTLTSAPDEMISLGLTAKYVMGNAMARAEDAGSQVSPSSFDIAFPVIHGDGRNLGHGIGMDLGLAWHAGRLTAGVTVQNVANSFAWDTTRMLTRVGTASFDGSTGASNFDDTTYAAAPAAMRAAVEAERFGPTIGGGLAFNVASALTLTADARVQTGDGIVIGPRSRIGAGVELNGNGALPLRVGAAKITDGWQGAAGVGLRLGDNHVSVSAMIRDRGTGARDVGGMINLFAFY